MESEGGVGEGTLSKFNEAKASIVSLMERVRENERELLKLSLEGEGSTVRKPRSPRSKFQSPPMQRPGTERSHAYSRG